MLKIYLVILIAMSMCACTIGTLMLGLSTEQQLTVQHEEAHAKFCEYTGGEAIITYGRNFFGYISSGTTDCYNSSVETVGAKAFLDGMNEEMSYPFSAIVSMLCYFMMGLIWLVHGFFFMLTLFVKKI